MIRPTSQPNAALAALLAALALLSMAYGASGFGLPASPQARWLVLVEIRLPRTTLAILIGAALGATGAALQGFLRNPLAEPGLLGITGGAAVGSVAAVHSGLVAAIGLALPISGLIGAALATGLVILLAGAGAGRLQLILAGVAVSSLAGALTTLALNLAPNPFASVEILVWLLGSLSDRSLVHLAIAAPPICAGLVLLLRLAPDLDALSLGDEVAANIGVDPGGLRRSLLLGAALAVGGATSVAGSIGFVGLIVPHLVRAQVGFRPGQLVAASALAGASLLLASDFLVRVLAPVADIKLGVITALIGAPFFLHLVYSTSRETAE